MPKNSYLPEYLENPIVEKSHADIFKDMNHASAEIFPDEPGLHHAIDFYVPVPPVYYEGRFIKGLFVSKGVDALNQMFPELSDYFISLACSQTASYPWSESADAYCTLYPCAERENWFRETHPAHADKWLVPLEDSDYLSEYHGPSLDIREKDIDLICVSRFHPAKNLAFVARGLKAYRQKYPQQPIRMKLFNWRRFDLNLEGLRPYEQEEYRKVEAILEHPTDYIEFIPEAHWHRELLPSYARAKVCVLGSLMEGKNRSMHEAMCMDTALLWCRDFNHYIRDPHWPAFPEGTGLACAYDPEDWADTLHALLENYRDFQPRRRYFEHYGRKNFLNTCVDSISYYADVLPDYEAGRHHLNPWWDAAIFHNYQVGLIDFLYGRRSEVSLTGSPEKIKTALAYYIERSTPANRQLAS